MTAPEINYFFDVNKFEKNRNGGEQNFTQPDGTQVRQFGGDGDYVVEIRPPNSPYVYASGYNEKGEITMTGAIFYGNAVGKWLYFNDKQQVTKELDRELSYPFSIEALAQLLKENYDIDLYDLTQIPMMQRYIDTLNTHKPIYIIYAYREKPLSNAIDSYLVDGETGKVLFHMKTTLRSDDSVYNEYIKTTEEYKQGIYKIED